MKHEDILRYIGENIKSNIREIEGAINKLAAYSRLENKEITMDIAREELQNIISPDKPREITPQLIIEVVAEHYDLSMEQMTSNARAKNIAKPRQIAMYLCKQMTSVPLEAIGNLLGGRDHSTIIHGANKISEEYEKDGDLRQQIETINRKFHLDFFISSYLIPFGLRTLHILHNPTLRYQHQSSKLFYFRLYA